MTTKILILKSMRKCLSNSNNKKKKKSEKSIAGFEPASFSKPVRIHIFYNAIPTRPLGT